MHANRTSIIGTGLVDFALIGVVVALAIVVGWGCNGDSPPATNPDVDGGTTGGGFDGGGGGGGGDFGFADAGETTVLISGWVLGADATERELDGSVSGFDGGVPSGAAATPGGRIFGTAVILRDATSGAELSRTLTDARGFYSLRGPAMAIVFQEVEPVPGYLGVVRAEETRQADYEAYDIYLPLRLGAEDTATAIGITYDATTGIVGCGFNPVTPDRGGEGAELGAGIMHAPAVTLAAGGVIMTNVLPPLCSALGGEMVAYPGGPTCTMLERSSQIHFLGTQTGFVPVTALSPPGGTCQIRYGLSNWLIRPDTFTVINIDCM